MLVGLLCFFLYSITFVTIRDYQNTLFVNSNSSMSAKRGYNFLVLGIAVCVVIAVILIQRRKSKYKITELKYCRKVDVFFQQKYRYVYAYLLFAACFCYLSYVCYQAFTEGPWGSDLIQVYQVAYYKHFNLDIPANVQAYIERYPNNLAISWYEILIFRLFNSVGFESIYITNTCIELTFLIAIIHQMFKQTQSIIKAVAPVFLLLSFIPMLSYLSFPYTDNLGVFGLLYMYFLTQKRIWQKPWFFLFLAIPTGIFLSGRANVIVGVVALSIIAFLLYNFNKEEKKMKQIFRKVVIPLGFLFLSLFIMRNAVAVMGSSLNIDVKKNAFPASHWLNMGQDEQLMGTYNHGDALKTQELLETQGIAKVNEYNFKSAIQRFKNRTLMQNWRFFTGKVSLEWSQGDFSMLTNLLVFKSPESVKYKQLSTNPVTHMLEFYLDVFTRIIYILLFFQTVYYIRYSAKISPEFLFLLLSFSGTVIFYILWESASRYGFIVMPILVLGVLYEQGRIFKNDV